jgi:hypothetical protein
LKWDFGMIDAMKAGRSIHEVGTRVRLKNIRDKYDLDLNGKEGTLAQPFNGFPIRDVGVLVDTGDLDNPKPACIYLNEFEVVR